VIILTTDPKKRTWPLARVGRGDRCTIFLHDPSRGISGNVQLSLDRWRETLAVIESAYDVGLPSRRLPLRSTPRTRLQLSLALIALARWNKHWPACVLCRNSHLH
jgi:hypothetical protein